MIFAYISLIIPMFIPINLLFCLTGLLLSYMLGYQIVVPSPVFVFLFSVLFL
jgi:hypothetical protein